MNSIKWIKLWKVALSEMFEQASIWRIKFDMHLYVHSNTTFKIHKMKAETFGRWEEVFYYKFVIEQTSG